MGFDEWTRKLLEEFNPAQERSLIGMLVDNRAWFTPTLAVGAAGLTVGMRTYNDDPRAKYIPANIWKSWDPALGQRKAPADEVRSLRALVQRKGLEFIPKLRDAGVPLLAGTDTGFANNYMFPGWSLHDEISLMREAGLTNFEALQTATINPVRYFKLEKTHGTIARDKAADLVMIDGNPLVDIRNTAKISGVMVSGKWYGKADLDKLLAEAAQEAATSRK
jgi:imidazolonepropionase-like amidohydrolase